MPQKKGKNAASTEQLLCRICRDDLESIESNTPITVQSVAQLLPEEKRLAKMAKTVVKEANLRGQGLFQHLSLEIHLRVFGHLQTKWIMQLLCTSTGLRSLRRQPALWRKIHLQTSKYSTGTDIPKAALQFIVPYLHRCEMSTHVRDLTVLGDWKHANDLKGVIKGFNSVERVELGGKKITDSILECAAKFWPNLRHLKLHDTKAGIDSKLKLVAQSKNLKSLSLDAVLDVTMMGRLGLATLREADGSSILTELHLDGKEWGAPSMLTSLSAWNVIGAQLPELTSFTTSLKIYSKEDIDDSAACIAAIPRLERLEISMSPSNRWGTHPSVLVAADPTVNIHNFLSRILPSCPRLQTLVLRYQKDWVSQKDAKAGKKPTPLPQKPNVHLWAPNLKWVRLLGAWSEE